MKIIGVIGCIFICAMQCAEQPVYKRVFTSDTGCDLSVESPESKYTVGFFAQRECVTRSLLRGNIAHASGICYGSGPQGVRLATITAQFFRDKLGSLFKTPYISLDDEKNFEQACEFIRTMFVHVHDHLVEHHSHFLTDNTCGVTLTYEDAVLGRLACFHLAQERLSGGTGFRENVQHDLHTGGIEKFAAPSEKVATLVPQSFLLMGSPRAVEYLEKRVQPYLDSRRWAIEQEDNVAEVVAEHSGIRSHWYAGNLGDFRLWMCGS